MKGFPHKMKWILRNGMCVLLLLLLMDFSACISPPEEPEIWTQYSSNPFVIRLDIPAPTNSAGGIIAADLDGDGLMDYLVTRPGHVAAYAHDGSKLWSKKTDVRVSGVLEEEGLPGHHGPGVQAADIDGDGRTEVLYLTHDSTLHVLKGKNGRLKWKSSPPVPEGAERWEHLMVGNFFGDGDRDLLLQATNAEGYRMGWYLAAYRMEDLRRKKYKPLWKRDDFVSCAHNGARLADMNLDGKDEILGQMLLGPDGRVLNQASFPGQSHADSVHVADVHPDRPGLEVVVLEEGLKNGRRVGSVSLLTQSNQLWRSHHEWQEPQNAVVGEFDLESSGLEIWCRSRHNNDQTPFVFSAGGSLLSEYDLNTVAPEGWTKRGLEVIWTIDWTGAPKQLAAAKERHESGNVAVFDPMTGEFVLHLKEKADRLYVADVSGDWREELIVLRGRELHIYHNEDPNIHPSRERLWAQANYRRSKQIWNYYSP